jgi:hypothetical protein
MKKIILIPLVLIALNVQVALAQCNSEEISNGCVPTLTQNGFNFLKSYKIDGETDLTKVEYSYVFTKGTQYMVTICDQNAANSTIMVTIFDSQRNVVATNKIKGSLLSGIVYPCNATGIYYLQYTFEGSSNRCGGSALGFKK